MTTTPDTPEGLYPGPDGTWFGSAGDVPESWQARGDHDGPWGDASDYLSGDWLQCRPAPEPETDDGLEVDVKSVLAELWGDSDEARDQATDVWNAIKPLLVREEALRDPAPTEPADDDRAGPSYVVWTHGHADESAGSAGDASPTGPATTEPARPMHDMQDPDTAAWIARTRGEDAPDPEPQGRWWTISPHGDPRVATHGIWYFARHRLAAAFGLTDDDPDVDHLHAALVALVRRANQPDPTAEQVQNKIIDTLEVAVSRGVSHVPGLDVIDRVLAAVAALREDGRA